ncbi:unnamed protein product [Ambrosiozyma monospora]|uniref:Unnamed protein product n=1 Tax=Ambrosiozyma monospora TaxID=43982 RepID=A0ACB5U8B7_AMBMO|nr:unnamed protein product [Ambrosiozyma monospora]
MCRLVRLMIGEELDDGLTGGGGDGVNAANADEPWKGKHDASADVPADAAPVADEPWKGEAAANVQIDNIVNDAAAPAAPADEPWKGEN